PVGPGGGRVGGLRGGPEVPAVGCLGRESAALVRDRSQGDDNLQVGAEVRHPDRLREGRGPGAGGAEEGGALADQHSFNRLKNAGRASTLDDSLASPCLCILSCLRKATPTFPFRRRWGMNRIPYQELDSFPGEYGCTAYRNEPFTGVAYREHPDGSVAREWRLRDGELWGPQRSWHADGRPASASCCVAGVAHGASRRWYPDGGKSSVSLLQYGNSVRKRGFTQDGRICCDFLMERDSQALEATKRLMGSMRQAYGAPVDAEPIPPGVLCVEEAEGADAGLR